MRRAKQYLITNNGEDISAFLLLDPELSSLCHVCCFGRAYTANHHKKTASRVHGVCSFPETPESRRSMQKVVLLDSSRVSSADDRPFLWFSLSSLRRKGLAVGQFVPIKTEYNRLRKDANNAVAIIKWCKAAEETLAPLSSPTEDQVIYCIASKLLLQNLDYLGYDIRQVRICSQDNQCQN